MDMEPPRSAMVKRAAPSRLVDIRATDGGLGGAVRGDDPDVERIAAGGIFGIGKRVTVTAAGRTYAYRVHPSDCKAVARTRAFFDALDDRDDAIGYAHARAVADALPDCDCFPDPHADARAELPHRR